MEKIANVAIMALLNAELMTIGFDEQMGQTGQPQQQKPGRTSRN